MRTSGRSNEVGARVKRVGDTTSVTPKKSTAPGRPPRRFSRRPRYRHPLKTPGSRRFRHHRRLETSADAPTPKNRSLRLRSARKNRCVGAILGRRTDNPQVASGILAQTLAVILEDFSDDIHLIGHQRCVLSYVLSAAYFMRKYLENKLAEGVGFEPTMPCGIPVFKTGAFDRSATPPCYRRILKKSSSVCIATLTRLISP